MQVVGEHLEEDLPVVVVDEAVVEDAGGLVGEELGAVVLVDDDPLISLQQAADHLKGTAKGQT